jgi:cytidyltransferase-like protein
MKVVLVTGGFDPIHSGHISYLNHADHLGEWLIVGLNSDEWLTRKKGQPFMSWHNRMVVLDNLHMVDRVISFDDSDDTACNAIFRVKEMFPDDDIIFANGGDRNKDNIPEMVFDDVEFVFGVGGIDKKNSSSWILEEWKSPKTIRPWGYYRILHNPNKNIKVKELTVDSGKCLTMQRHQNRAEFWFVAEGTATVKWDEHGHTTTKIYQTEKIHQGEWHQLINNTDVPLKIIEIQYGTDCNESDIERR